VGLDLTTLDVSRDVSGQARSRIVVTLPTRARSGAGRGNLRQESPESRGGVLDCANLRDVVDISGLKGFDITTSTSVQKIPTSNSATPTHDSLFVEDGDPSRPKSRKGESLSSLQRLFENGTASKHA